jgi:quercetin dioxygenase-like cupin family protein
MEITRNGTRPARSGPAEYFTGTVRLDPLMAADTPGRPAGLWVTFEPGARTNWHTHRLRSSRPAARSPRPA